jgi:hypothetical protein
MFVSNGRIYILHSYSYGPAGSDQNITFTYSDDNGATWINPQKSILKDGNYHFYPHFAMTGSNMVVAWLADQDATGNLGYKTILYMMSNDSGQTWGSVQTLDSLGASGNNVTLDMEEFNGKISLTYSVKNAADDSIHVYLKEIDFGTVTGTNKNINTAFSISPNPANENLMIRLNSTNYSGKEIEIINYSGSVVKKDVIKDGENYIDISHLTTGIYVLEVEDNGVMYREKFVKE